MDSENLTDRDYWEQNWGNKELFKFESSDYAQYYRKFLKIENSATCIEIGAFPGKNLGYIAKHFHYLPTALDFVTDMRFIQENMKFNGIVKYSIINEDFLLYTPQEKFHLVCSHGFVEHFDNPEQIIKKHIELLDNEGILIITVPNLNYFQIFIRKVLYPISKMQMIEKTHNKEIMNLRKIEDIVIKKYGLKKKYAGYCGGMTIWFSKNDIVQKRSKLFLFTIIKNIEFLFNRLNLSSKFFSPEMIIIAQKCDN